MMNDRFGAIGRGEIDPVTGEATTPFGAGDGNGPGARGRARWSCRTPGGPGGFAGGRGGFLGGRGVQQNRIFATTNYSFGGSALDSRPYRASRRHAGARHALTRHQSFGGTIGGPFKIPHVYDGSRRTSFVATYNGSRGTSLFDQYATVPTDAMRAGDFSGSCRSVDRPGDRPAVSRQSDTGQPHRLGIGGASPVHSAAESSGDVEPKLSQREHGRVVDRFRQPPGHSQLHARRRRAAAASAAAGRIWRRPRRRTRARSGAAGHRASR